MTYFTKQEIKDQKKLYGDRWWSIVDNAIFGDKDA